MKTSCCGPVFWAVEGRSGEGAGQRPQRPAAIASEGERCRSLEELRGLRRLHGCWLRGALLQPDLNYPWVVKRFVVE